MLHEALIKLLSQPPMLVSGNGSAGLGLEDALQQAISPKGALPISQTVVRQLSAAADAASGAKTASGSKGKLADLLELVQRDPILMVRLLAQVNRAFYQRGTAITSVGEAIKLLGTKRLLSVAGEVGTPRDLQLLAKGHLTYAAALHEHVVATQFAEEIYAALPEDAAALVTLDSIQVVVALLSAPLLALAWVEPEIYAWMALCSSSSDVQFGANTTVVLDRRSLGTPVERVFGFSRPALTLGLVRAMRLPEEFQRILGMCSVQAIRVTAGSQTPEGRLTKLIAAVSFFATELAQEFERFSGRPPFESFIRESQQRLTLPGGTVSPLLQKIQGDCIARQQRAGLPDLPFPDAGLFSRTAEGAAALVDLPLKVVSPLLFGSFIEELQKRVVDAKAQISAKSGAPTRLALPVWLTLQALVRVLQFERAALLVVDFNKGDLRHVASFGVPHEQIQKYCRSIQSEGKTGGPELRALHERKAVWKGVPITPDGAHACAFPIIQDSLVQGVFYAERVGGLRTAQIPLDLQMLVVALAECWQDL